MIFFSRTWFLFFNKFERLFFFFWLFITCFVLIGHHYLTNVTWVNLFKHIFSISTKQKQRENKIFSILPLFHSPIIFYHPTFSPFQPNGNSNWKPSGVFFFFSYFKTLKYASLQYLASTTVGHREKTARIATSTGILKQLKMC